MTAVEWLVEQQKELLNQVKSGKFKIEDFEYYNNLYIEQAKEMEEDKDQETYSKGYSTGFIDSRKLELEQHKFNDEFQGEQIIDEQDKSAILSIINNNNEKYTK